MSTKDDLGGVARQWQVTVLVTDDGHPTPFSRRAITKEVEDKLRDFSAGVHGEVIRVRLVRR